MGKGKIKKVVGKISDEIVDKYHLYDYRNREIIQSLDLYIHAQKHANDFKSVDSYNNALFNIPSIILSPYFVYYDIKRNSLLYFKEIDEYTCVVVKLNLRKNKDIYVATVYPVSKNKIDRLKELSYISNRA